MEDQAEIKNVISVNRKGEPTNQFVHLPYILFYPWTEGAYALCCLVSIDMDRFVETDLEVNCERCKSLERFYTQYPPKSPPLRQGELF